MDIRYQQELTLTSIQIKNLTVKAVVDIVNDVVGLGRKGSESAFVLLDQVLLGTRKSWDIVQITNVLVWSVGGNLSCNSWV